MIVNLEQAKAHLNVTLEDDDAVIARMIGAAQNKIERALGFKIENEFGSEEQEDIPEALVQAVLMLVGHYYENREATTTATLMPVPLGVDEIVREFREYSFG